MTKAVIYARYSSHGQTEQSIEGQLHDGYAYAERMGYQVVGEYIDRALTGTKDQRPDFQRMIRDAEKKTFSVVIVWKLDRFARNRYDSAIYKARLKKSGVRVVSVMEAITDSPEGIILEGLLESMAEYYSANLSENVRRGQRESVTKGWFCGGHVPYGYRAENHRLVPRDGEADIAREIFRRYAAGDPLTVIADDLNRRGYRTRAGAVFRASSFDSMVKNPAYAGRLLYNGQEVPGCADALIDEETYARAVARRQMNKRAPAAAKAVSARYLLQGKAFCGHCGAPMVGESGHGHLDRVYQYYSCADRKKKHTCKKKNEKKDLLERYVVDQTVRYILDPSRTEAIARAVAAEYKKEFGESRTADLERRIRKLDADLNALVDDLLTLPKAAHQRIGARIEQLEAQKADLEADLARLRLAEKITLDEKQIAAWIRSFHGGSLDDPDYCQRLIDSFVNSIYIYDDKIVIFYNLQGSKETSPHEVLEEIKEKENNSDLAGYGLPLPNMSEPFFVFVHGLIGLVSFRTGKIKKAPR